MNTDHMPVTVITNVEVIGTAPDGTVMHRWLENGVAFEEYATTVTGTSGTVYGLTLVRRA